MVDAAKQTCGDPGEVAAVVARHGQGAAGGGTILWAAGVGIGFEEDLEEARELALGAEFFRDAADVGGEGFAQFVERSEGRAKALGAADGFLGRGQLFEGEAGEAAKLEHDAQAGDGEEAAGGGVVELAVVFIAG